MRRSTAALPQGGRVLLDGDQIEWSTPPSDARGAALFRRSMGQFVSRRLRELSTDLSHMVGAPVDLGLFTTQVSPDGRPCASHENYLLRKRSAWTQREQIKSFLLGRSLVTESGAPVPRSRNGPRDPGYAFARSRRSEAMPAGRQLWLHFVGQDESSDGYARLEWRAPSHALDERTQWMATAVTDLALAATEVLEHERSPRRLGRIPLLVDEDIKKAFARLHGTDFDAKETFVHMGEETELTARQIAGIWVEIIHDVMGAEFTDEDVKAMAEFERYLAREAHPAGDDRDLVSQKVRQLLDREAATHLDQYDTGIDWKTIEDLHLTVVRELAPEDPRFVEVEQLLRNHRTNNNLSSQALVEAATIRPPAGSSATLHADILRSVATQGLPPNHQVHLDWDAVRVYEPDGPYVHNGHLRLAVDIPDPRNRPGADEIAALSAFGIAVSTQPSTDLITKEERATGQLATPLSPTESYLQNPRTPEDTQRRADLRTLVQAHRELTATVQNMRRSLDASRDGVLRYVEEQRHALAEQRDPTRGFERPSPRSLTRSHYYNYFEQLARRRIDRARTHQQELTWDRSQNRDQLGQLRLEAQLLEDAAAVFARERHQWGMRRLGDLIANMHRDTSLGQSLEVLRRERPDSVLVTGAVVGADGEPIVLREASGSADYLEYQRRSDVQVLLPQAWQQLRPAEPTRIDLTTYLSAQILDPDGTQLGGIAHRAVARLEKALESPDEHGTFAAALRDVMGTLTPNRAQLLGRLQQNPRVVDAARLAGNSPLLVHRASTESAVGPQRRNEDPGDATPRSASPSPRPGDDNQPGVARSEPAQDRPPAEIENTANTHEPEQGSGSDASSHGAESTAVSEVAGATRARRDAGKPGGSEVTRAPVRSSHFEPPRGISRDWLAVLGPEPPEDRSVRRSRRPETLAD